MRISHDTVQIKTDKTAKASNADNAVVYPLALVHLNCWEEWRVYLMSHYFTPAKLILVSTWEVLNAQEVVDQKLQKFLNVVEHYFCDGFTARDKFLG